MKIEPCDICNTKYTEEMCEIANKFLQDEDPCYCEAIKKIVRLVKENKKLKELKKEVGYLNALLADADESSWDMEVMYKDCRDGTFNGNDIGGKPDKKMAKWIAQRYDLNEGELQDD